MGRSTVFATFCIVSVAMLPVGGCSPLTIPIPVSLTDAGAGEFEVTAGAPVSAKANFSFTLERSTGSGHLSIDPADISIQPANTGGAKVSSLNLQDANACRDVCLEAGVEAEICDDVCVEGELRVTIWIGTQEAIGADCEAGDRYVIEVELDASGNATSIDVSPASLTQGTIDLLNGGSLGVCVEVIAPIDGTVIVDSLTFNLGL